jgi:AraC family transcriptional regulator
MKKYNKQQQSRINDALVEIHKDISASLTAKYLANIAAYSEQHFHRVFNQIVGQTVNVYIRQTRLEHAANQLMFDHSSSVLDVAEKCGFTSLSSFNQIFKKQFGTTPGQWRQSERTDTEPPYLHDKEVKDGYIRIQSKVLNPPKIVTLNPRHVAYIRHLGYGRDIKETWQLLHTWAIETGIQLDSKPLESTVMQGQQIGLHHSNPEWVKLENCLYVACMTIDRPLQQRSIVNSLTIPGGIHARFQLAGQYGDLLPYIGKILNFWLPNSGYKLQTTPVFVQYIKNHFLSTDDRFDAHIFIPISAL